MDWYFASELINANGLTPVVADQYPTLVSDATPNGSPAIHFNGPSTDGGTVGQALHHLGTDWLPTGTADRTVFMFRQYNYTPPIPGHGWGGFAYGNKADGQCFGLVVQYSSDLLAVQGWGGGKDFVATVSGYPWMSQSATLTGSDVSQTLYHYKNGTQIDLRSGMNYNTGTDRIVLGVEIDETGFQLMDVAELLVYDRVLTEAERGQVENYFIQKWVSVTPPIIPQPVAVLTSVDHATGDVTVNWDSTIGIKYVLQYKDSLSAPGPGWVEVVPGLASPVVGTGGVVSLTDYGVTATHRFYRVLVVP